VPEKPPEEILLQTISPGTPGGRERAVTLRDIFNYFSEGKTTKAIMRTDPAIRPETVALARAFLVASYPEVQARLTPAISSQDYKILIDENISPKIAAVLPAGFGHIITVKEAGLMKKKDPVIWEWAVNENCDAILTRDWRQKKPDTDLTLIAIEAARKIIAAEQEAGTMRVVLNEMPVVIHFKLKGEMVATAREVFSKFEHDIKSFLETVTAPYIEISNSGVRPSKTYAELVREKTGEDKHESRTRIERWHAKWRRIILNQHKEKLSPGQLEEIDNMVRAAAQICAQNSTLTLPPPEQTGPSSRPS
jgi:hypothetical protein